MTGLRVLAVTNWYPPQHLGGYELQCFDAVHGLAQRGHHVRVLCGDTVFDPDRPSIDPDHERDVERVLRLYHDGDDRIPTTRRDRVAIERHNQRAFARVVREFAPDVVSVWHLAGVSHGLLAALERSGLSAVFVVCDDWLVYGQDLDPWASAFARSPLRRAAGRVVTAATGLPTAVPDLSDRASFLFVTRFTEERAMARSRWQPSVRTRFWGGVDTDHFRPGDDDTRPWRWRLITTGRFDPRKGYETAIRALPLLPEEATLHLWGRGGDDERRRLAGVAGDLGVGRRVRFGSLDRDDLAEEYRAADAMVFPSVWDEPFGLAPVEAMACGVPVVATGVGGSSEFLADGDNCVLFPPDDPAALAASLRTLAGDEALRARVVAGGLRTAADLHTDRLVDLMEQWHTYESSGRSIPRPADRPTPGRGAHHDG